MYSSKITVTKRVRAFLVKLYFNVNSSDVVFIFKNLYLVFNTTPKVQSYLNIGFKISCSTSL